MREKRYFEHKGELKSGLDFINRIKPYYKTNEISKKQIN